MTQANRAEPLTAEQIDFVLCDIASTAKQIDRLIPLLIAGSDEVNEEAILVAIECMIQRIGWAADMAMARSERSLGPCFGDAEDWMMPPLFHREATPRSTT